MSTEKETQKIILSYLTQIGVFHYRQNSGSFKNAKGNFYRFASINGLPDIMAFHKGTAYAIECKDKKGVLSPAQKEFQKKFEEAGGVYIIAKEPIHVISQLSP